MFSCVLVCTFVTYFQPDETRHSFGSENSSRSHAKGERKTDLAPSWRDAKKHEAEKHLPSSLYGRRWALTALWSHIRTAIKPWRLSWANANRQADVQRTLTPIVSARAGEISSLGDHNWLGHLTLLAVSDLGCYCWTRISRRDFGPIDIEADRFSTALSPARDRLKA